MLPNIWIFDTYSIMLLIGIIACFALFYFYSKKNKTNEKYVFDILILALISIAFGLLFAMLFQMMFDLIKNGNVRGAMTFYGGLIGGVVVFILGYFLYIKKHYKENSLIKDVAPIAPACITIAHAFGRIGCFLAGCCYGIPTDSPLGVQFPNMEYAVYPTQLFEAIFLFILTAILFFLAYKYNFLYTFPVYMASYGIFRFLIEFIRGDERGELFNLPPSQIISILLVVSSIVVFFILKRKKEFK